MTIGNIYNKNMKNNKRKLQTFLGGYLDLHDFIRKVYSIDSINHAIMVIFKEFSKIL